MSKTKPETLAELRDSGYQSRSVKDEIRSNLIEKLKASSDLFPGVVGYKDSVIPQLVNALLAKQSLVLLGLRGQAKTRILRSLANFLDDEMPIIRGSEVNDDPLKPLSAFGRRAIAESGDNTQITWISRDKRYVEKLAIPDTTVADLIGDLDPIRAARGGYDLSSDESMQFGLIPRANRGIFAMNELPDLAGKVQVSLFNVMQEGDVQIKGLPVRIPVDVLMVFSANPEDYTARGKIITPLKDRVGAEIRTHYPEALEEGIKITKSEVWLDRNTAVSVPEFIWEIVEAIAFIAREDQRIDHRSGVSQRVPITVMESAISNAERRLFVTGDEHTAVRIADIYAARSALSGKLELEYEGEQIGAERITNELIRRACGEVFSKHVEGADLSPVIEHFSTGGVLELSDASGLAELHETLASVPELLGISSSIANGKTEDVYGFSELILEGLHARRKLARHDEYKGRARWKISRDSEYGRPIFEEPEGSEGLIN